MIRGFSKSFYIKAIVFVFIIAVIAAIIYRTSFGVNFTDEAWYLAMGYRFVLGDKPYQDELFLMQGFSILISPVLKLYYYFFGTESIILFGRLLYWVFKVISCLFLVFYTHSVVGWLVAILGALFYMTVVPFCLPNISYNTLGVGLIFLTGLFLYKKKKDDSPIYYFIGGILSVGSIIACPALLPVNLLFFCFCFFYDRSSTKWFIAGGIITLLLSCLIFQISPNLLIKNIQLTINLKNEAANRFDFSTIIDILEGIWRHSPFTLSWIIIISVYIALYRKWPRMVLMIFGGLLPLLSYFHVRDKSGGYGLHGLIIFLAILGLLFYWVLRKNKDINRLYIFVAIPSLMAGICLAFTSYNGPPQAGVGMIPAAVITCFLIGYFIEKKGYEYGSLLVISQYVVLGLYLFFVIVYNDDPIKCLRTPILEGPFKGLKTTEAKARYLMDIQRTVKSHENTKGRIIFYEHFPAGYLFTKMLPATPTTWGCLSIPPSICTKYYETKHSKSNLAIEINSISYTNYVGVTHSDRLGPMDDTLILRDLNDKVEYPHFILRYNKFFSN